MSCPLCDRELKTTNWFYVVECNSCNVPMVVSVDHKSNFSQSEKEDIKQLFGAKYRIRWEQRDIKDHAHCHLEEKK